MSATRTYSIVLEPMEEGGFLVHVPALPALLPMKYGERGI